MFSDLILNSRRTRFYSFASFPQCHQWPDTDMKRVRTTPGQTSKRPWCVTDELWRLTMFCTHDPGDRHSRNPRFLKLIWSQPVFRNKILDLIFDIFYLLGKASFKMVVPLKVRDSMVSLHALETIPKLHRASRDELIAFCRKANSYKAISSACALWHV